jgi:hypothetical protein
VQRSRRRHSLRLARLLRWGGPGRLLGGLGGKLARHGILERLDRIGALWLADLHRSPNRTCSTKCCRCCDAPQAGQFSVPPKRRDPRSGSGGALAPLSDLPLACAHALVGSAEPRRTSPGRERRSISSRRISPTGGGSTTSATMKARTPSVPRRPELCPAGRAEAPLRPRQRLPPKSQHRSGAAALVRRCTSGDHGRQRLPMYVSTPNTTAAKAMPITSHSAFTAGL